MPRPGDEGLRGQRQHHLRAQPRVIIEQLQHTAVQPGDRVHEAQAEPHPRCAAAGVAAEEAFRGLGLAGIGNPWASSATATSTALPNAHADGAVLGDAL